LLSVDSTFDDVLCTVKRGKTAPSVYLTIPFAAIADAPFIAPYTSAR